MKCAIAKTAESQMWGEYHSAANISSRVKGFCPKPVGKGDYFDDMNRHVYFYLQDFHDMDVYSPPDPAELASMLAELHRNGASPNGMFGYDVVTGGGLLARTVTWEKSWATQFTYQLKDVIKIDNEANSPWPEYDAACQQIIDHVIPRLLGALQSDGREITPTLVHGDLWEGNLAIDLETGKIIAFDCGSTYSHNEIEFGTWRCSWATHFTSPIYQMLYQREIEPSEPVEEWDDRNRLYAIRAALCDSAGHPGSNSRQM
jgi:protein-ribulosamine 3-kinase